MRSIPQFLRGHARISWTRVQSGQVQYRVSVAQRSVDLNPGMLAIGLLADGRRDLGEIFDALVNSGLSVSDPAIVVLTFRRFEDVGAVDMRWHLESLGPVRHVCTGCGMSCTGHIIGPLRDAEVTKLRELKVSLEALEPELPDADPVATFAAESPPVTGLNMISGQCVFLTRDRQCAIHRHYGIEAKPICCQLFPLVVIETEDGFRVGISGRCTSLHRSFESAPPKSAEQAVRDTGLTRPPGELVGLNPGQPRSLRYTGAFQRNEAQEGYLLSLLGTEGMDLTRFVATCTGNAKAPRKVPVRFAKSVAKRLRRFAKSFEPDPLNVEGTLYGDAVRQFVAELAELETPEALVEPPAVVSRFFLHTLREFVYLRETTSFPQVEVGVQAALVGLLGVLWTTAPLVEGDLCADLVGHRTAYWLRILGVRGSYQRLFISPQDYANHRTLLTQREATPI